MEDLIKTQLSKFQLEGERLVKVPEKKLQVESFGIPPYLKAVNSFKKAAENFDKAKSWDHLGATYVKLSECYLKIRDGPYSPHYPIFAANYYIKAAYAYSTSINIEEAVSCVKEAVQILMHYDFFRITGVYSEDISDFFKNKIVFQHTYQIFEIAKAYSEIAKEYEQKYEQEENLVQAILCYEITVRVYERRGDYDMWSKIDSTTREKISKIVERLFKVNEQKDGKNTYYFNFKDKTFKQKNEEEEKTKSIFGLTSKNKKFEIGLCIFIFTFWIWFNYYCGMWHKHRIN